MKRRKDIVQFRCIFAIFVTLILCVMFCMLLPACGGKSGESEETKYDVAIRVKCSDGTIYDFPVGEDEKHITIPYDGVERTFGVYSYNLPDHPRWGNEWFSPSGEGANVFQMTMIYSPPGGSYQSYSGSLKEKGEYCITIEADATSNLWKFRAVYFYITIN